MANPMNAVRAALRSARALAYVDAVYRRGSQAVPIQPIRSDVEVELIDGDGSVTIAKVTLWRVLAEELVIQGEEVEPEEGDRIEYQVGNKRQVYEVQAVGGANCWEPTDPHVHGYKIKTRMIDDDAT